jgi:hypothetical protein
MQQFFTRLFVSLIAALVLLVGASRQASAQDTCVNNVCPLTFSSAITVRATISCAVVRPAFDYGSHFRSEGRLYSNSTNFVEARCTIDPKDGVVDISFPNLPSVLTREGGTETVPLLYGVESLRVYDCLDCANPAVRTNINPAAGGSHTITSGALRFALGENGDFGDEFASIGVDITNAAKAGRYVGTITAQIALR